MKKILSVAVVGCGGMGRHHASVVARLADDARLVAVCDGDQERAREVAGDVEGCQPYADVQRMLGETKPDVVHVCTPPASHVDIARASIHSGAHIYVEKPFAESLAETRSLLDLAAERSLKVCAGHQVLFERPARLVRGLMPRIGEVRHVDSFFSFRPTHRKDGRPQRTPVEQLLDILPHPTYLLLEFLGAAAPGSEFTVHGSRADETGAYHAVVSSGRAAGTLVATLEGRPVDSYLRVVGTRGTLTLDFVRGIVIPSLGTGTTIEKILDPYGRAWALLLGSTRSLARRFFGRQWSYPGLAELIGAFYSHIRGDGPAPVSAASIERTVEIGERAKAELQARLRASSSEPVVSSPQVAVTGGTGLLGRAVVRALVEKGVTPLALARRLPLDCNRDRGAEYAACDLAEPDTIQLPPSVRAVIHCAAEVYGGFEAHQRNSVEATKSLLDAMQRAGVGRLIHISSLAVIAASAPQPISERSPLEENGRSRGPYVWGKLESEKVAAAARQSHGIEVAIIRPGPLVDPAAFEPPGKLGRALTAGLFVAVGNPRATIPLSDVNVVGEIAAAWASLEFDGVPPVLNALNPVPARRRDLVRELKDNNPGLRVLWLYRPVLVGLALPLILLQKVLQPKKAAIDLRTVFDAPRCDTTLASAVVSRTRDQVIAGR